MNVEDAIIETIKEFGPQDIPAAIELLNGFVKKIAKGNEPVAWLYESNQGHRLISEQRRIVHAYEKETPLYTLPPTASQIDQETAEAWISVNERLPELRDEVLVYCGYFTLGYRSDDIHDPECHQGWVIDFDNGNAHGITHWQPLPTPPKRSMEGV